MGQGAAFALLGALLAGVLAYALVVNGWDLGNVLFAGLPALALWWLALRPRAHVTPEAVTLYSYLRSLTIPREQLDEAIDRIRPRSVVWMYGADIPEIALRGGRPMLLPMFVVRQRRWFTRLPGRFLASPQELSSSQSRSA